MNYQKAHFFHLKHRRTPNWWPHISEAHKFRFVSYHLSLCLLKVRVVNFVRLRSTHWCPKQFPRRNIDRVRTATQTDGQRSDVCFNSILFMPYNGDVIPAFCGRCALLPNSISPDARDVYFHQAQHTFSHRPRWILSIFLASNLWRLQFSHIQLDRNRIYIIYIKTNTLKVFGTNNHLRIKIENKSLSRFNSKGTIPLNAARRCSVFGSGLSCTWFFIGHFAPQRDARRAMRITQTQYGDWVPHHSPLHNSQQLASTEYRCCFVSLVSTVDHHNRLCIVFGICSLRLACVIQTARTFRIIVLCGNLSISFRVFLFTFLIEIQFYFPLRNHNLSDKTRANRQKNIYQ